MVPPNAAAIPGRTRSNRNRAATTEPNPSSVATDQTSWLVTVAIEAPRHTDIDGPLTYRAAAPIAPGTLVRVPLGRREVPGVVWGVAADEPANGAVVRPVSE